MSIEYKLEQRVYCPVYDLIGEVIEFGPGQSITVYFKDKIFDPYIKYSLTGKLNEDYSLKLEILENEKQV